VTRTRVTAALPLIGLLLSFAILYRGVIEKLVFDWEHDDNYSHGFLIVPIALYFAWERRQRLLDAARQPSALGLVVLLGSIVTLVAGILGAELFLTRVSIVGVVAGSVLYVMGWQHLRILALPVAFLLLMIPIPAIIFNQVAFPLQLLASRFGETALTICNIPVLREGNVIVLANTTLEVAEACSGIRSLVSLLTLGIIYSYFTDPRQWVRVAVTLSTVPIAIVSNGLRVAGTGVAAHFYGGQVATGFLHTFSGWAVFLVAFTFLFAVMRALQAVAPERAPVRAAGAPPAHAANEIAI
jgi:exosortase